MKKKILLWLLGRLGREQEELEMNGCFAIDGQPVRCQLCKQPIQYPPIKVPLGPPQAPAKDPVFTPDGYCLNPETIYGRFHLTCASRYIVTVMAKDLEYQPNTETANDEPDSG
jgi:hypothetical protein